MPIFSTILNHKNMAYKKMWETNQKDDIFRKILAKKKDCNQITKNWVKNFRQTVVSPKYTKTDSLEIFDKIMVNLYQ